MQLNSWLIPIRPFSPHLDTETQNRANRLGAWLVAESQEKNLDVLLLQEVWSPGYTIISNLLNTANGSLLFGRRQLVNLIKTRFPHMTKIGGCPTMFCSRFFDSGLLIASRFPIIHQDFHLHVAGDFVDSLSSKGVLVAALNVTEPGASKTILVVASSHLDAGTDKEVNIRQMDVSATFMRQFTEKVGRQYPDHEIVANIFGLDMNVDGKDFWTPGTPYARIKDMMAYEGYKDSWLETHRDIAADVSTVDWFDANFGVTFEDVNDGPLRLDYIWVRPGVSRAITAISMERNDGSHWRFAEKFRQPLASLRNDKTSASYAELENKIDKHNRETFLSDHASLLATVRFEKKSA
jgi:hypothetical protein